MNRGEIKNKAKEILQGRRGHAALILLGLGLVYLVAQIFLTFIPFIGAIVSMLIGVVYTIVIGIFTINFCNTREKVDVESLVPNSFTVIWKYAVVNLLFVIISMIIVFPGTMIFTTAMLSESYTFLIIAILIIIALSALISIPLIFAPYIIIENQDMPVGEMIAQCFSLTFSNLGKIIVMYLTLIPWYLLAIVTLGIGLLYVAPYVNTIMYVMYKDIKGESIDFYNPKQEIF